FHDGASATGSVGGGSEQAATSTAMPAARRSRRASDIISSRPGKPVERPGIAAIQRSERNFATSELMQAVGFPVTSGVEALEAPVRPWPRLAFSAFRRAALLRRAHWRVRSLPGYRKEQ